MEEATGTAIGGDERQPDMGQNATPNSRSPPPRRRRKKDMTLEGYMEVLSDTSLGVLAEHCSDSFILYRLVLLACE
jgi:hypothetical protein